MLVSLAAAMPLRSALLWLGLTRLAAPAPAEAPQTGLRGPAPEPGPHVAQIPEPPPGESELRWSAPPGCPDRAALLAGIARRRGRPLVAGEVDVDARISRNAGRHLLRLRVRAGARSERRSLAADTCAPLADATALLITLALDATSDTPPALPPGVVPEPTADPLTPPGDAADPPATADTPPASSPADPLTSPASSPADPLASPATTASSPAGPLASPATPATGPATPATGPAADPLSPDTLDAPRDPAPAPAPLRRARRPGGLVRLHGGLERGAVPGFSGDVGLALGLLGERWRLELAADFIAPRTRAHPQADLRASLLAAGLHACARPGRGALELPLCGGLELGGMRGSAHGPAVERSATGLWFAGVLGVGLAWRFHPRLALWAALQGRLAVRPSFQLRDPGPVVKLFEPWPVSGRLLLGLELRLGDPR